MIKRYEIAGLTVDMDLFGRTEKQAAAYAIAADGPADITLEYDAYSAAERHPYLRDPDMLLYMATGALFARELLNFDGTYLHASSVILDGKAYLFSADSGVGKSTHTEKWCRLFGAVHLNDDKPVIRLENGKWMAYGTPWSGKHDLSTPAGVELGGIAFLSRGRENTIRPMESARAIPLFMKQSTWKLDMEQMDRQLALLDKLMRQVPLWELSCRNDDDAAYLSRKVMTGVGADGK